MSKENCTKYLQKRGKTYPRTCKECGLSGCKYENYDKAESQSETLASNRKPHLWELSLEDHNRLKFSGMLYEFHPNACGNWYADAGAFQEMIEKARTEAAPVLKPIRSAPKDRYILLAGDSGYTNTKLRFEAGRWSKDKNRWVNHAGDAFTDGGPGPIYWMEIPKVQEIRKTVAQWLTEQEFKGIILLDNWSESAEYSKEEFTEKLLSSRVQVSREKLKEIIDRETIG